MGAQLVTLARPGPWLLLARPPDPDDDVVVPHPAFLPATMDWQNSRNSPAG
jgi:hypothetical protein